MIVSDAWLGTVSSVVFTGHLLLIFLAVPWIWIKAGPFRAGLAMLLFALLPFFWQIWFTESDAKGVVLLMLFTVPPSLLLIAGGIVAAAVSAIARWRSRSAPAGL